MNDVMAVEEADVAEQWSGGARRQQLADRPHGWAAKQVSWSSQTADSPAPQAKSRPIPGRHHHPYGLSVLQTKAEELMEVILERARVRGEIGRGEIPTTVITVPFDLARHRFLMRGLLTAESIDDIIDTVAGSLIRLYACADPH